MLPAGFVYLKEIEDSILIDLKYYTHDNFIGRPVKGYEAPVCIMTIETAVALSKIQQTLLSQDLSLKIFDAYRPQMAVDDFITWSLDKNDLTMKTQYYPHIEKMDLFALNYLAKKSSHSRGSTVDLTIVRYLPDHAVPQELSMGTRFDYLDELSHPFSPQVEDEARFNRLFLRDLMQQAGFQPIETEWWHFTLIDEPFPTTYFNFPVR